MGPDGGQRLVEGHQPLELLPLKCVAIISLGCQLFQCAGLLTVGIAGISVLLSCGGLGASCGPCHPEGCLVLRHIRQAL